MIKPDFGPTIARRNIRFADVDIHSRMDCNSLCHNRMSLSANEIKMVSSRSKMDRLNTAISICDQDVCTAPLTSLIDRGRQHLNKFCGVWSCDFNLNLQPHHTKMAHKPKVLFRVAKITWNIHMIIEGKPCAPHVPWRRNKAICGFESRTQNQ